MHAAAPRRARSLVLNEDAAQAGGEEPAAAAEAEPEEAPGADADPQAAAKAEKKALRDAIAELEAKLPKARGNLVAALDAKKDAGENGYMLLAANFERARVQARSKFAASSM